MRGPSITATAALLAVSLPVFAAHLPPTHHTGSTHHNIVARDAKLPVDKIYGVNIGNWLVFEPWMTPSQWLAMDGQFAASGNCSESRQSEWSLATYLGQDKTNDAFQQHWQSWLTQEDVDEMAAAKLNAVRVPLGFWVVEDIVDRATEPYAQGGLDELIRGLSMFKAAGLNVLLDHHALPGVSSSVQMFAGNCTPFVSFYDSPDDYNYKRAVTWGAVMTWLSHTHPEFSTVFAIQAVNEPEGDSSLTPGLDKYYKAFTLGIRAVEYALGVSEAIKPADLADDSIALAAFTAAAPIIDGLSTKYSLTAGTADIQAALNVSGLEYGSLSSYVVQERELSAVFMPSTWQSGATPANGALSAQGSTFFDMHQYLNFGGIAPNASEESYMQTICNSALISKAALVGDTPVVGGEWSLATAFNTTTDWLKKYADAQKQLFAESSADAAGWMFWTWKIGADAQSYPILGQHLQWSYKEALAAGIFTADPAEYNDEDVCEPYKGLLNGILA